jgi:hypothetical protein
LIYVMTDETKRSILLFISPNYTDHKSVEDSPKS